MVRGGESALECAEAYVGLLPERILLPQSVQVWRIL